MLAIVTDVRDKDEVLEVIKIANKCLCVSYNHLPEQNAIEVIFAEEGDVERFDIEVCDLGFDVEWVD